MFQDIKSHKLDYSLLALITGIFITFFVISSGSAALLMLGTLVFAVTYILWGIWHHGRTHSLTGKIMLEYILVSMFGILVVGSLLL